MKRPARIAIGVLAVLGAAWIVLSIGLAFLTDCTTLKISSAVSPSGKRIAEHHQRVCKSAGGVPKTEIHLVQEGERVSTDIGESTTNRIGLTWKDEDSLVISVPAGMDKAFDQTMQGVELEFEIEIEP